MITKQQYEQYKEILDNAPEDAKFVIPDGCCIPMSNIKTIVEQYEHIEMLSDRFSTLHHAATFACMAYTDNEDELPRCMDILGNVLANNKEARGVDNDKLLKMLKGYGAYHSTQKMLRTEPDVESWLNNYLLYGGEKNEL